MLTKFIKKIAIWLGLHPSERDKEMKQLVENSYKSIRVVGRGTIKIDPKEVASTEEFKHAQEQAKLIVESK